MPGRQEAAGDSLIADPDDDDTAALEKLLDVGVLVACVPPDDSIQLCCDRDVLLFGLALARRVPGLPPRHRGPHRCSVSTARRRFAAEVATLIGADEAFAEIVREHALEPDKLTFYAPDVDSPSPGTDRR